MTTLDRKVALVPVEHLHDAGTKLVAAIGYTVIVFMEWERYASMAYLLGPHACTVADGELPGYGCYVFLTKTPTSDIIVKLLSEEIVR